MLTSSTWRRRDFLQATALAAIAAPRLAAARDDERSVIFLNLVGGPSQLDTWDPKPDAPSAIRSRFAPIATNVPGVRISELFPRMARQADKYAILRTLHHEAAAVHDTGRQLLQTGRVFAPEDREPHLGCVVARLLGPRAGLPAHVLLPRPLGETGGGLPHGQDAGFLGAELDPALLSGDRDLRDVAPRDRERYGDTELGRNCLLAGRLVQAGVRFVTVNQFDTVFNRLTWDMHGAAPFTPAKAYQTHVAPAFDHAFSALIEDLDRSGRLDSTLIVAAGECGRTPKINANGGRDHWTRCWSILMAGGGVQGGRVIGESDATASEPKQRPIAPAEVVASVYHVLGLSLETELRPGRPLLAPGVQPIRELFA